MAVGKNMSVGHKMSNIFEGLSRTNPAVDCSWYADKKTINEAEWKTMSGQHILVDDDGGILAGGPKEMRTKASASKKKVQAAVKDANKKSVQEERILINVDDDEAEGVYYPAKEEIKEARRRALRRKVTEAKEEYMEIGRSVIEYFGLYAKKGEKFHMDHDFVLWKMWNKDLEPEMEISVRGRKVQITPGTCSKYGIKYLPGAREFILPRGQEFTYVRDEGLVGNHSLIDVTIEIRGGVQVDTTIYADDMVYSKWVNEPEDW